MLRERFGRPLDRGAVALSSSVREDAELLGADLWASRVHARMLGEVGILPVRTARRLEAGLRRVARRARAGRFPLDPNLEDVHLNVESALTRELGEDGERLHTGRSRNDQVATDLAVYTRGALLELELGSASVARALLEAAAGPGGRNVVVGWTHLQPAQRVYLAQVLGTHALRFARDAERFRAVRSRLTDCPLGSAALAGSSLPLDRRRTARLLGFARPGASSLDGVSDRDGAVETLAAIALAAVHASSLAEELVLGAMPEIGRVRLPEEFVTTSSLMPHKRNPDLAELVRAEAAPAIGRLGAHLALLKGLPLAYNRDLQVGKPLLFEGVARLRAVLDVLAPMVAGSEFPVPPPPPPGADRETASVELLDALVRAGLPFRAAHARVGRFLAGAERRPLADLPRAELLRAFPELARSPYRPRRPEAEPEPRTTEGGSAWREVDRLLAHVARRCRSSERAARAERARLERLRRRLDAPIRVRPRRRGRA